MKLKKSLVSVSLIVCLFILSSVASAKAVNWLTAEITAEGFGAAYSKKMNPVQAQMIARRAAIADTYRNLADIVQDINIDAKTPVLKVIKKTKMSAVVHGAVISAEQYNYDGSYKVTMKLPLYGKNSLAEMILPMHDVKTPFSTSFGSVADMPGDVMAKDETTEGYTGLVLDCRGLVVSPVMLPALYDENKRLVYGYKNLDAHKVANIGMVKYANDIDVQERTGANPLVVKVGTLDNRGSDPVISATAADFILLENKKSGFLDKLAVMIVM